MTSPKLSYEIKQDSLNMTPKVTAAIWIANLNSRLALYSLTAFMIAFPLNFFAAILWLLGPLAKYSWFLQLYRLSVAFTLCSGFVLFISLFIFHRFLAPKRNFYYSSLANAKVHVGLTAYNDEVCIGNAVRDFKSNPQVDKVIVIDNNSIDNTYQVSLESGADLVVTEPISGYGSCCQRALAESAVGLEDDDVIILCEGDLTFSGHDVNKFLAYLENADLVLGTRATQELRETHTQMDWLINPGNQIVAKMIQTRFWGTRLTDCGCTYRAIRVGSYRCLRSYLMVHGNYFSPHMFIEALKLQMRVIEIPVVFRARSGESKGVGSNKIKAARVALQMLGLLYTA
ncbi:glycosyltransferase [Synechococcus sp. PCC 7336]|uniref:glycosyltransferase n=1 Tax=Synechococcus sp. PCC 7336 TaxID=195250 RepID=UPI00034C3B2A|nr:glycosyltransferase [Synechococcus sp. PCC 7336]